MRLALSHGDMFLELDPMAGGCVSALRHRDLDILRPAPCRSGPAFDARDYGAFPMVPFVGRIHNGVFYVDGQRFELPANLPPESHAIHGHGWRAAWKIESQSERTATLIYNHKADAWPWDYVARQTFELREDGLDITLSLTNASETLMPAGFGWHPYFWREDAEMMLATTHKWSPDDVSGDNRPDLITPEDDLSSRRRVDALNLDTTFSVHPNEIKLIWPTHAVRIKSDSIYGLATVYVPPGEDFFCAEPITHAPNAINSKRPASETGFRVLAPDETLSGKISLFVEH